MIRLALALAPWPATLATLPLLPATGARAAAGSPLAGTWVLVEAPEIRPDGSRGQTFGPNPQGLLVIDADGRYALQIYRPDRPRFASGDKRRGTADEYAAAAVGMSAHYGTCAVDAVRGTLVFRIERASFPNWDGTEQRRAYTLAGDTLSYRVPAAANGNGTTTISTWRRIR